MLSEPDVKAAKTFVSITDLSNGFGRDGKEHAWDWNLHPMFVRRPLYGVRMRLEETLESRMLREREEHLRRNLERGLD